MSQTGQYFSSAGAGNVETLTGNTGGAVLPTGNNINVIGSGGVTVSGNPGTSTLTITGGASFTWNEVTTGSQAMTINNGYITNFGSVVTLTLPSIAPQGSIVRITGKGAGGWSLSQNAGQTIYAGSATTTTGTGGSLASTLQRDTIELVCITANSDWNLLSVIGNITVV